MQRWSTLRRKDYVEVTQDPFICLEYCKLICTALSGAFEVEEDSFEDKTKLSFTLPVQESID